MRKSNQKKVNRGDYDLRLIPKTSKVKMTFYKGITIPDIIIGFIALISIAITLTSNFPFKWIIVIVILCFTIPLYLTFGETRLYHYIGFLFKYLSSRKVYQKNSKNLQEDITGIIPYNKIENDLIVNRDNSFVGVLQINPIDFRMLSLEKQNGYIEEVFSKVINNINLGDQFAILKLERPLILDSNIEDELERLNVLLSAKDKCNLTKKEWSSRVDIVQDRIQIIDEINSRDTINYSTYYLCLISSNKNSLNTTLERAETIFKNSSISVHRLKEKELLAFLRYGIDNEFDERELDKDKEMKDYFIPNKVTFDLTATKQNNKNLTHFVINNFPLKVGNGWAEGLFDMENTKVIMKLNPVEKTKAIKRIDNTILEIQTKAQKEKVSNQIDTSTHLETLQDLLIGIQTDNETLFDTTIIITVYDEQGQNINKKKVRSRLREMGFGFSEMIGRQFEAYVSSSISLIEKTNISRGIQTTSLAASFPFVSSAILDKKGILIGENKLPVFIDFFKRDEEYVNSNMVIIGKPGSGKSYATKTLLCNLASCDTRVFVLDPENEYGKLAKCLGGKTLNIANGACGKINPFHIISGLDEEGEENSFYSHLQFLEQFYRIILKGINTDSLEILNKITQEMYELKGINSKTDLKKLKPENYPIFDDLYSLVENKEQKEKDDYTKSCLKIILNYISKFKTGGRNSSLWNGYTTFSPNENFVAFNFQKLLANKNDVTANAQMLLVIKWLENEIIKNRDLNIKNKTNKKFVVAIDECHLFIDEKYPIALDFMYQLAKRIRKYNGMLIIITQNIKDFAGNQDTIRKSSAIINVSQYSLIFSLSPNDMTELCKLYENAGAINENEKNSIVHNKRGSAFLILSPNKRTNVDIVASKHIESLFE